MNTLLEIFALTPAHLARASGVGGFICGVLDLACALGAFRARGIGSTRVLQGIASAALGPSAFEKGTRTAGVGVFFHFVIAFSVATFTANRQKCRGVAGVMREFRQRIEP